MKKLKYLLLPLFIVSILLITGCKDKTAISAEEFKTKMEEKQYSVDDLTNIFVDSVNVEKVYIATSSDTNHQIAFYQFSDTSIATNFYEQNKTNYESNKKSASSNTSVELKNYSKYTLKTNDEYKVLSRIDNTVIMLEVNSKYENDVKNILKELGY